MGRGLTRSELYLLECVRRVPNTPLMECRGPVLDTLQALGLVSIARDADADATVQLTPEGVAALRRGRI